MNPSLRNPSRKLSQHLLSMPSSWNMYIFPLLVVGLMGCHDKREPVERLLVKEGNALRPGNVQLLPIVQAPMQQWIAQIQKDPQAIAQKISVHREEWQGQNTQKHSTYRLQAPTKEALQQYLHKLSQNPQKPLWEAHQKWTYQQGANGQWTAYLTDVRAGLQFTHFQSVQLTHYNPKTTQRDYNLKLKQSDSKTLHAFTSRHLGHRIALCVDQTIVASPVVKAALTGSAIRLTMLSRHNMQLLLKNVVGNNEFSTASQTTAPTAR